MNTVIDQSFGVVPIIKNKGTWQVLLVNQISHPNPTERFWTFPKGHPEKGESPIQTAERELLEETGIERVRLIEDAQFIIHYTFSHKGKRVEKTVTYFLGVCTESATEITLPEEIADLRWLSFVEARDNLAHKNTQSVLLEVEKYINTHTKTL